ncbi:hypothetical protein [Spiroplasma alleghenense]|uniref:Uncharacterized protein n=1 Tax=Spiroplasma alleghenense TaxID=216931 RepID=A0A345Z4L9_9MOLU|nr:hypothetical protein [Spiroplasma alleghenense]AXK51548.1 hypothetical protein SALLE_v1c08780 [Spiroplasma alleghenense]
MKQSFSVIFKFSLLRIIKSKVFIIISAIIIALILLIQILTMSLGQKIVFKTQIAMTFIIGLSIFWISFVNINNAIRIAIIDERSGLQSLQNRRGVKKSTQFFAKFLPLKIITTSFVLIVFMIFVFVTLMYPIPLKEFVVKNLSIGLFSLIAYDFLIFGLVFAISSKTKSLKKALPVGWVIMTMFMLFPLLGTIFFLFESSYDSNPKNIFNNYEISKHALQKTQNEKISFLNQLSESLEILENELMENITTDRPGWWEGKLYNERDIIDLFLRNGLITLLGDLIEKNQLITYLNYYLKNFDSSLANESIIINESKLKDTFEKSLYYQFVKSINIPSEGKRINNYHNSYFYKNFSGNWSKPQQLKEVIDNFRGFDNELGKISSSEISALIKTIKNIYDYEFSINLNRDVLEIYETDQNFDQNVFLNYQFWIDFSPYSPGSYLFNIINYKIIDSLKEPFNIDKSSFIFDSKYALNYQINPFMIFYEMAYFSGSNDPQSNHILTKNSVMPISGFTFYDLNSEGDLIYSKRPFIVWLNYLLFIGSGIMLTSFGYRYFNKQKSKSNMID